MKGIVVRLFFKNANLILELLSNDNSEEANFLSFIQFSKNGVSPSPLLFEFKLVQLAFFVINLNMKWIKLESRIQEIVLWKVVIRNFWFGEILQVYHKALTMVQETDRSRMAGGFMTRLTKLYLKLKRYKEAADMISEEIEKYMEVKVFLTLFLMFFEVLWVIRKVKIMYIIFVFEVSCDEFRFSMRISKWCLSVQLSNALKK